MALATNLKIDEKVAKAFAEGESGGDGPAPFLLTLTLEGTEVKLVGTADAEGTQTVEAVFAKVADAAGDGSSPRLFLFRAADPAHEGHSRWTMCTYVPEGVHPKTKMLLAAARDDVKRNLEASRFSPDYAVTEKEDLTAKAYLEWRNRDRQSAMSSREIMMQTVMAETNAARMNSGPKMAGMAQVPFKLDDTVVQACLKTAPKLASPKQQQAATADVLSPASHHSSSHGDAASATAGGGDEASVSGGATGSPSTVLSPSSVAGGGEGATAGSASSAATGGSAVSAVPTVTTPPEYDFIEMSIAGETIVLSGEPKLLGDSIEAHKAAIKASISKEGPKGSSAAAAAKTMSPGLPGMAGGASKVEPRYFLIRLGYSSMPAALPSEFVILIVMFVTAFETLVAIYTSFFPPIILFIIAALLYYCPEGCPPRNRMTYSTAKAAVIDGLKEAGCPLSKSTEARDEDELNTALENAAHNPTTSPTAVGGGHSFSGSAGSSGSSGKVVVGSPEGASAASHGRTPSKGFGGVGLPGMAHGGFALPGMGAGRSPLTPSSGSGSGSHHGAAGEAAAGEGESGGSSFPKPSRPGQGPARVMGGFALPGLSPPGAK
jgi:Cofilin/tropomyosin-type actin-binding protein